MILFFELLYFGFLVLFFLFSVFDLFFFLVLFFWPSLFEFFSQLFLCKCILPVLHICIFFCFHLSLVLFLSSFFFELFLINMVCLGNYFWISFFLSFRGNFFFAFWAYLFGLGFLLFYFFSRCHSSGPSQAQDFSHSSKFLYVLFWKRRLLPTQEYWLLPSWVQGPSHESSQGTSHKLMFPGMLGSLLIFCDSLVHCWSIVGWVLG